MPARSVAHHRPGGRRRWRSRRRPARARRADGRGTGPGATALAETAVTDPGSGSSPTRSVTVQAVGLVSGTPDLMTSLNPVLTVGRQIEEVVELHQNLSARQAAERAIEMLRLVHIPEPQRRRAGIPAPAQRAACGSG